MYFNNREIKETMKKKLWKITLIACLAAALTLAAAGCAAYPNTKNNPKLTMPKEGYAVLSNGGSAVQYGDYVYFINGTDPNFTDEKGTLNRWGEVIKGGICRVKLENGKDVELTDENGVKYKVYQTVYEPNKYFGKEPVEIENFKADEKKITVLDKAPVVGQSFAQMVVPKVITFSNDAQAGIFIYDNWIYYSSPANRKDKSGTVQYSYSDFFRTRLDGTGTQPLYTSKDAVKAFNFYHYKDRVYLVCHEGDNLISLPIGAKKTGTMSSLTPDEAVITEVMFPRKETYYKGIKEDTACDFVYYTRELQAEDGASLGNVMECFRPDFKTTGKAWDKLTEEQKAEKWEKMSPAEKAETGLQLGDNNNTYALAGAEGGTFFYYETQSIDGIKRLKARNFSSDKADADIILGVTENMSEVKPFNGVKTNMGVNVFYALAVEGSDLKLYAGDGVAAAVLASDISGGVIYKVADKDGARANHGNTEVFYAKGGVLYSLTLPADMSQKPVQKQLTKGGVFTGNNFNPDFAGGLIWFLGADALNQKDFAVELRGETVPGNFMYIKLLQEADKDEEYFIGILGANELPEED